MLVNYFSSQIFSVNLVFEVLLMTFGFKRAMHKITQKTAKMQNHAFWTKVRVFPNPVKDPPLQIIHIFLVVS
jgi:hypothetical protein